MAIDLRRCAGCGACVVACQMQNNQRPGVSWNNLDVYEWGTQAGESGRAYVPNACVQCEKPACVDACPTGASVRRDDGITVIDYEKCIGCRRCMAAFPYNARVFNWNEPVRATGFHYGDADVPVRPRGVAEKCSLCKERTDRGDEPMCVHCCPGDARVFGDLDDPDSAVSRLWRRGGHVLLEEKGTRPQMFYVN